MLQKAVDENSVLSMLNEQKKGALVHLFPILLNIRASHCSDAVLKFRQILYQQSIQAENP